MYIYTWNFERVTLSKVRFFSSFHLPPQMSGENEKRPEVRYPQVPLALHLMFTAHPSATVLGPAFRLLMGPATSVLQSYFFTTPWNH